MSVTDFAADEASAISDGAASGLSLVKLLLVLLIILLPSAVAIVAEQPRIVEVLAGRCLECHSGAMSKGITIGSSAISPQPSATSMC